VPEGNTVWLTAQLLRGALAHRVLTAADLRVPSLATVDLRGRRVADVVPRGKHLLIRLAADPTSTAGPAALTLHSHLRMDGSWRVYPPTYPVRDRRDQVRVILQTETSVAVGYRLHDVRLVATARESQLVGRLGPDLLGPDWDAARALPALRAEADRAIGEALLDQRNLAGIGNVYKAETCFLAGVSPWTAVGAVPDLAAVVHIAHALLNANRERYDHVTTGDARAGHRVWVYDRAGQPCRRCAAPIRADWQGSPPRLTYWCPRCQPAAGEPAQPLPPPPPAAAARPRRPHPPATA
jgi:endonuclease VIII